MSTGKGLSGSNGRGKKRADQEYEKMEVIPIKLAVSSRHHPCAAVAKKRTTNKKNRHRKEECRSDRPKVFKSTLQIATHTSFSRPTAPSLNFDERNLRLVICSRLGRSATKCPTTTPSRCLCSVNLLHSSVTEVFIISPLLRVDESEGQLFCIYLPDQERTKRMCDGAGDEYRI